MDGCVLYRKDRSAQQGDGIALEVREHQDGIDLCPGADEQVESLWIRIKGQANKGVCCRPPDQGKEGDESLWTAGRRLTVTVLEVILEDFSHLDTFGGTTWLSTPSPGS